MRKTLILFLLASSAASAQGGKASWERMSRNDSNEDGKISKSEFKGPNAERAFSRFDTNNDGFISETEVNAIQSRSKGLTKKDPAKKGGGRPDNAPAQGAEAPNVKAKKLNSEEFVDLGAITKTTVLIFGSYT